MQKLLLEQDKTRKYIRIIYCVLGLSIIFLSIVQLFLSNHVASYGAKLLTLTSEEKQITQENELLLKEISQYSSLAAVSKRATEMSFVAASKFIVIKPQEIVALAR